MKFINTVKVGIAMLAFAAASTYADGEIRGGVTAVSIVAGNVAAQTPHNGFRWGQKEVDNAPLATSHDNAGHSGLRWAETDRRSEDARSISVKSEQTASKWIIRNDSGQAASKWIIRSDSGQAASKWIIRSDADQAASKWIIRSDADQSASKWIIR